MGEESVLVCARVRLVADDLRKQAAQLVKAAEELECAAYRNEDARIDARFKAMAQ